MSKESALAIATGSPAPADPNAQAPQTQAPEPPKSLDSERFAAFAKKEAGLVKREEEAKRKAAEADSRLEKMLEIQKKADTFEQLRQTDGVAALKSLGYSETDIFNMLAGSQKSDATPEERAALAAKEATAAEIKAFKDEQAQALERANKERDDRLIAGLRSELTRTVESDKDKYEFCNLSGPAAQDLIFETVQKVLIDSKGTDLMTAAEAAEMVEQYYEGIYEEMSKTKKGLSRINPAPSAPAKNTQQAPTRTRTLSNEATATVAAAAKKVAQSASETRDQKRARLETWLRNGKPA